MDCPRCSIASETELGVCPACGATLDELVPVFQVADAALLPLLKSVLEAAGIDYLIQGESALGLLPLGPLATGLTANLVAATIQVPEAQAAEARELLTGVTDVAPDDDE